MQVNSGDIHGVLTSGDERTMDYAKHTDADLMSLIRSRDVDGFDTLRLRYVSGILRHLQSIVHDADAAEDLLQETFLRVWTSAEQWDGRGTVKGWLYRISTNLALNGLRAAKRRRETPLEIKSDGDDDDSVTPGWMIDSATPGPPEALEHSERSAMLRRLIGELPEEKRELIKMVYEAEMEVRQAAEALGIPEGTAKSRLHYSAKHLAREWRNRDEE